ncbi:MAG: hypothetical protein ACRETA_05425 [Gammaproteobacteria bacterium]
MSLGKIPLVSITLVLLAGCATVPQWQPPAGRQKVAVAAIVNPMADQIHLGITVFGNSFNHADIGFDINQEISQVVRDQLAKSGRYDLVDMPVEPKAFTSATCFWNMGWTVNSLCKPLADKLVQNAKGRGIDYIIGVIDVRSTMGGAEGWGLFQHHGGCYSAYVNYFVFVLNARTGVTEASTSYDGFRRVEDIDWDAAWSAIPDAKRAEVLSDLKSIVHEDIPWTLTALGIVPGNAKPIDYGVTECHPYMGG